MATNFTTQVNNAIFTILVDEFHVAEDKRVEFMAKFPCSFKFPNAKLTFTPAIKHFQMAEGDFVDFECPIVRVVSKHTNTLRANMKINAIIMIAHLPSGQAGKHR